MTDHRIGTREEWLAAREQLLPAKRSTPGLATSSRGSDASCRGCGVEEYRFDTDGGEKALGGLFDGRSQLLVDHFMFGPSYQAGCPVNSSIADTVNGVPRTCTLATRRSCSFPKHRWRSCRPTSVAWAGVFPGSRLRAPTSTSTSASRTPRNRPARPAQMRPTGLATRPATGTGLPPIVEHNASSTGTDVVGYLTESPGSAPRSRRRHRLSRVLDDLARIGVSHGVLPDPRSRTDRPRRGRGVAALDPPARRVRERVTRGRTRPRRHRRVRRRSAGTESHARLDLRRPGPAAKNRLLGVSRCLGSVVAAGGARPPRRAWLPQGPGERVNDVAAAEALRVLRQLARLPDRDLSGSRPARRAR